MSKYLCLFALMVLCVGAVDPSQPIFFPDGTGNFRPLTGTHSTVEIPVDSNMANSLSTIQDFANFYNFNLPQNSPSFNKSLISTRVGGQPVTFDAVEDRDQAHCIPELTPVALDIPQNTGFTYFPTCIRVERCGGCCFLPHQACKPTREEKIMIKSVKVEEEVTKSRRRRVRNVEANYIAVEVAKHLECQCRCRIEETDCNLTIQFYNEKECSCQCKNSIKEEQCRRSNDHFWNADLCECLCRQTRECSSGLGFNHETCSCR